MHLPHNQEPIAFWQFSPVLGNLRAIPTKLAEIRNPFGCGHGKSASFQGLEERHAKLAAGSGVTLLWKYRRALAIQSVRMTWNGQFPSEHTIWKRSWLKSRRRLWHEELRIPGLRR